VDQGEPGPVEADAVLGCDETGVSMATTTDRLEEIAGTYDSATGFDFDLIRYNHRELRPLLSGPKVLEVGCASGVITRWLAADFPVVHVVDGSAQYIKQVARAVGDHVQFHHALFEEFQPPHRFNDIVMARARAPERPDRHVKPHPPLARAAGPAPPGRT
jgi:hypothetical protein